MARRKSIFSYVFIHSAKPGKSVRSLVGQLAEQPHVLFATDVVGAYEGFAVLKTPDLATLHAFLADPVWEDQKTVALEGQTSRFGPAKRDTCEILALVRIKAQYGKAKSVLAALAKIRGDDKRFHGASMIFGEFDILLTLDAGSVEDLKSLVLTKLQDIPGVVRTETSFADCRKGK